MTKRRLLTETELQKMENKKKKNRKSEDKKIDLPLNCRFCEKLKEKLLICYYCNNLFCNLCSIIHFDFNNEINICLDCKFEFCMN